MPDEIVDIDAITRFKEKCDEAYEASKNGYVQHVNKSPSGAYYLSDWYDASTVASFENGRRLN